MLLDLFFFNDTATTENYTRSLVGSVRCVKETEGDVIAAHRKRQHRPLVGVVLVNRRHFAGRVTPEPVSYTHLRAHETVLDLVCRLLLEKKKAALLKVGRRLTI